MKFNTYLVELEYREFSFTENLIVDDKTLNVNFKRIAKDLYTAYFKNQVQLRFMEKIKFKNREKYIFVLLPMISKYNKRKLTKLSKIFSTPEGKKKKNIVLNLLIVEKFLKVEELLNFLSINKKEFVEFLIEMELKKGIKIIDVNRLIITSYKNYLNYLADLNSIIGDYYRNKKKTIKLVDIESKLKLPKSSIFFKYLLNSINVDFPLKIINDNVILQKIVLSEKDKESMEKIVQILRKNKLSIFSIEKILKLSDLMYDEVNDSLWFLLENGEIIQLNEEYFMFNDDLNKILNRMKKYKRNRDENIDIQSFREMTLFNRKNMIILFEYFDSQRITERVGNKRKILLVV